VGHDEYRHEPGIKYRCAVLRPTAPLVLTEGAHCWARSADFGSRLPNAFAQHFSDLKFSSTSHEVENNNVAEIALHNLRRVAAIDALQRGRFFC
jgi:hypothetical protein